VSLVSDSKIHGAPAFRHPSGIALEKQKQQYRAGNQQNERIPRDSVGEPLSSERGYIILCRHHPNIAGAAPVEVFGPLDS
jgi:hypothetical protein